MRLKKIKLAGFKSFVDPTSISLPSSMIGVVGPNGCGKSNVIDAVRWVMGESSARHLRGDSLTDVIFNGSKDRKPVSHAMIELVFDNREGRLGGQYAQYNEISVKRQLNREGQSTYFLNGTRCRRRDITDVFLGTGLGPRSYAIIEQGTISRIIEAKPEELRVFLEEAAGISKYKERRRETENRIRHTKENLSRISDLIGELEKRLQTLQRQSRTAEKYKELKREERLLKAQLLVLRWQALNEESTLMEREISSADTAMEGVNAELRSVEADIERQHQTQVDANEQFNVIQGRFYGVGAEIARIEQAIQHANEKRQQNEQDLQEVERNWLEASTHLETDQQQVTELEQSLEASGPQLESLRAEAEQSAATLRSAEQSMHDWQQTWDEFNHRAAHEVQQAEVLRTRIEHLEEEMGRLVDRRSRLEQERSGLDSSLIAREMTDLNDQINESDSNISGLQDELHVLLSKIEAQREHQQRCNKELNELRQQLQAVQKQHASLEALQQAALGKQQGAITDWLQQNSLADRQRLAEAIQVEQGWETGVETVLGLNLEAVCVDDLTTVSEELASLDKGTLTFFDTRVQASAPVTDLATPLATKVKAPWQLSSMLAGVYAVENTADALALRTQLKAQESVVTRAGLWFGRDWLRVARPADEKAGVLAREQELKQLAAQLEQLTGKVAGLEQQIDEGDLQARLYEEQRNTLQLNLNQASHRHAELRSQLSSKQGRYEQLNTRLAHIDHEVMELMAQIDKDREEVHNSRAQLEQLLQATEQHASQRQVLIEQRDTRRQTLDAERARAQHDRDAAREIEMRIESIRAQLQSLRSSLDRMQQQQTQLNKRREELNRALMDGEAPLVQMNADLEQLLDKRLVVESELSAARQTVADLEHALRELADKRSFIEQKVQDKRSELEQMRMAWQEIKVRRQTLQEQIDESEHDRDTVQRDMPAEASEEAWQQMVEQKTGQIQRLGAINLAAIDEFAEESERKQYLDSQAEDLNEALTTLENAIRKIDQETRARFKDTFDTVNERLKALFPRLFGGGVANLEMTSDDLLDAGVTVMARPPGKRNSSIHLLSGGEKALTAVAMVFALFELNPAPFCMLDEVDAPLDDTNAARFVNLVKEMSDRVQFIFITHNKITMELADQLIGVTMQEPGVSRSVTVDVDEAVQMAEAV